MDYFSLLPRRLRSDVSRKCEWKGQEFFWEKILICLLLTRLPFPDDSFAPAKVNTWNGGDRRLEVSVIKKNMLHSSASSWVPSIKEQPQHQSASLLLFCG